MINITEGKPSHDGPNAAKWLEVSEQPYVPAPTPAPGRERIDALIADRLSTLRDRTIRLGERHTAAAEAVEQARQTLALDPENGTLVGLLRDARARLEGIELAHSGAESAVEQAESAVEAARKDGRLKRLALLDKQQAAETIEAEREELRTEARALGAAIAELATEARAYARQLDLARGECADLAAQLGLVWRAGGVDHGSLRGDVSAGIRRGAADSGLSDVELASLVRP